MSTDRLPRVRSVEVVSTLTLRLTFTDGSTGEVDCTAFARSGGVFESLRDPAFFGQVRVNPDAGTIEWPNGVDLCPDVLYAMVRNVAPLQPVGTGDHEDH